ncbi:MAG: hypothetical protein KDA84_27575 [Planctomycetaceae bacterium]|nr:hypothetical protein [Planctomycetaceae bacterium]
MSLAQAESLVKALMYEGYALYPYRASAVKNRLRWTFGCLLPRAYCEQNPSDEDFQLQTECLVLGEDNTEIVIRVRFLQIVDRRIRELTSEEPPMSLGSSSASVTEHWQESIEREVVLTFPLGQHNANTPMNFPATQAMETMQDKNGHPAGVCIRESRLLQGVVNASVETLDMGLSRVSIRVVNQSNIEGDAVDLRDRAILNSFVSTHLILSVENGEFVSLLDPPEKYRTAADTCSNNRVWPVLVGREGSRKTMLASPIILYDYPRIAPESPGNLFDGTEIDEVLSLRIQTLTEDEKREAAQMDARVRELLERTHGLSNDNLQDLHGRLSRPSSPSDVPSLRPGDRVRLHPQGRADAMDVILEGLEATIQSLEEDFDGNFYVTVTIDGDPGRDLGQNGLPGHRFFFRWNEVELLDVGEEQS